MSRRQPTATEHDRVSREFDPDALKHLCTTWDFSDYATKTDLPEGRFYWYQDNGSNVLAVAHLDTVQGDRSCEVVDTAAGPLAVSGALDDRLGVYVILDLLPRLGVTCDWLLTTDEEIGRSTATEFAEDFMEDSGKQYHWIIQFDRGGTDVVMYDYETPEYASLVEASGARVGVGSYSDICELDDLGCAGFNWGVAYEDYHSPRSHAWLNDTFRMVARFLRFHEANVGEFLPHDGPAAGTLDDAWLGYYDYDPIEADCSHMVDLADERTYMEWVDGCVICADCAELTHEFDTKAS
jgi:hypothetical protein